MDINPVPEYKEELQLGYLKPEQYFDLAIQVVEHLGWQVVSSDSYEILCHTPGDDKTYGESISIKKEGATVTFYSRSANEYYWIENQNETNAALFKESFITVIENNRKVERSLKVFSKEKAGALIPSKTYLVTPLLIYINILVFIIMVIKGVSFISPDSQALLLWGGNFRPLTTTGQWWRLFTSMFLHGGVLHLLMNMYALLYIGMFLEPLLGKIRFAATYFLTGVCASLMSVVIHSYTVGVGASGAIFGAYGVFLAMLTTQHIERAARKTMLRSILFFVAYNLLYGMQGNIDNAAHIGGLLSGIIVGYIYYPGLSKYHSVKKQLGVTSLIALAIAITSVVSLRNLPNDILIYEQKMRKFADIESMALEVFKMNANAPKEDILYNLKERGVYYWNEDLNILNEIAKLDLPAQILEKNSKLIQYCKLRIEVYNLLYTEVRDDNRIYSSLIEKENAKISSILSEVKK